jgi:hypothetical protein
MRTELTWIELLLLVIVVEVVVVLLQRDSCFLVWHCVIETLVIKIIQLLWGLAQSSRWSLKPCNSQLAYVEFRVIQTAFICSSIALWPVRVNETCNSRTDCISFFFCIGHSLYLGYLVLVTLINYSAFFIARWVKSFSSNPHPHPARIRTYLLHGAESFLRS